GWHSPSATSMRRPVLQSITRIWAASYRAQPSSSGRDAESGESLVFLARDYAADRTLRQLFQTVRLFQEGSDDLRMLIHMLVSNHRTRGGERSLRLIARSVLATLRLGDLPYAYRQ